MFHWKKGRILYIPKCLAKKVLKFYVITTKTHANHRYLSEEMDRFFRECPRVSQLPRIYICYGVYVWKVQSSLYQTVLKLTSNYSRSKCYLKIVIRYVGLFSSRWELQGCLSFRCETLIFEFWLILCIPI